MWRGTEGMNCASQVDRIYRLWEVGIPSTCATILSVCTRLKPFPTQPSVLGLKTGKIISSCRGTIKWRYNCCTALTTALVDAVKNSNTAFLGSKSTYPSNTKILQFPPLIAKSALHSEKPARDERVMRIC